MISTTNQMSAKVAAMISVSGIRTAMAAHCVYRAAGSSHQAPRSVNGAFGRMNAANRILSDTDNA